MEYRLRRADGEYRWLLDEGVPRFAHGDAFLGYIGCCVDISERKRAQEETLARQKLESMGLLASGIAHDFNNLLGGILACAELATAQRDTGEPFEDELRRIETTAIRGAELVRQLMIYAGDEGPDFEPVDVKAVVDEMLQLLKVSIPKHVILRVEHEDGLPVLHANPPQLRQIVMNLVNNAADAIGKAPGEIQVSTGAVKIMGQQSRPGSPCLTEGDYLRLSVSDTGAGMTEKVRARIFDPFFSTKRTGRGLGLAMVQGIVRAHRGAINLESAPGRGAKFEVFLPCAQQAAKEAGETAMPEAAGGMQRLAGTVLIVEDEVALRFAVCRTLEKKGFTVIEASDGVEAVSLFRANDEAVDVVLLDMSLPGMSGRDVLAELEKIRPGVKVILTSAYPKDVALAGIGAQQFWRFVQKPIRLSQLTDLFDSAFAPDVKVGFTRAGISKAARKS
jgi:signal transduction histidine kinase/CheY-like chemotaxis protein